MVSKEEVRIHFAIAFEPSTSQHDLFAADLCQEAIGLSNLDSADSTVVFCQEVFGLCLPHDIGAVECPNVVEQCIDYGMSAALNLSQRVECRGIADRLTSGKTKC